MKKRIFLTVLLFIIPATMFALVFPVDLYVIDTDKDFAITLGCPVYYLELYYGSPITSEVIWHNKSTGYTQERRFYSNFEIMTDSLTRCIKSFKTQSMDFETSRGIRINDKLKKVRQTYGKGIYMEEESQTILLYEAFIPEINMDGEYTRMRFRFTKDGILQEFDLSVLDYV